MGVCGHLMHKKMNGKTNKEKKLEEEASKVDCLVKLQQVN